MMIILIQTFLFILGVIPLLCELSRHFYDSFLTMLARLIMFSVTIVCGFYAPYLKTLPDLALALLILVLAYFSYTTIRDIIIVFKNKKLRKYQHK